MVTVEKNFLVPSHGLLKKKKFFFFFIKGNTRIDGILRSKGVIAKFKNNRIIIKV
jgi:hypothetical protein